MQETLVEYVDMWYFKPDGFAELGGVWPIRMGTNIAKPTYRIRPRQIPYCNIHFIHDGQVELIYGDRKVVLGKGDMFCKFPNKIYSYQIANPQRHLRMTWFTFDGHQAQQLLTLIGFAQDKPFQRGAVDKDIELVLHQIFQRCKGNGRKHLITMISLMYRIFSKLLPDTDSKLPPSQSDGVNKCLDFIHAYYSEKITVADLSKYVGLHRTYLSKIFTKEVGMPPSDYLIKTRLDQGKQLLQDSSLSVTEIASSVGYPDIYSFTRAFTRRFGCSPNTFRKQAFTLKYQQYDQNSACT
ncbi:AraC family transcriptional regulator [Cohnella sp. WQ 127256]|uniref:AraC family transcriptional regulator n=1 Tax=Cohnella sp. WQ 127256 TaxID=2938790 RepID=UPI002118AFE4|nr:AraC family transcriptional regulator [Cohnella sp. WQ 127256]